MLDLSTATGWEGWKLARYGRAREWRLFSPQGNYYIPGELADLEALRLDVDFLRRRVRELERELKNKTAPDAINIGADDAAVVRAAVAVLERVLPTPATARARRFHDAATGETVALLNASA